MPTIERLKEISKRDERSGSRYVRMTFEHMASIIRVLEAAKEVSIGNGFVGEVVEYDMDELRAALLDLEEK